jgi:acyl-CoA dehydrogenase
MRATIDFFESKGKEKLPRRLLQPGLVRRLPRVREGEPHLRDHVHAGRRGRRDARWDTWRICEFAEILGFYGLQYWYTLAGLGARASVRSG